MARVDPALAAARAAVRAELADLANQAGAGGLTPGGLVLVACSGGADSLALAAATADEARRVGRSVRSPGYEVRAGAVVVDHGMQPGSAEVAATAAARCRALGLDPVLVRRVRVAGTPGSGGPEAAAREARYAALDDAARETGAAAVLLGHTQDDQAESVLLGLARGSGARSLAGMPRRRGLLRRPFLGLRRAQTEAACRALGLDYWTDPTNLLPADDGPAPTRTRVRGAVVPVLEDALGPGVVEALARTAGQLRDDADLLDALAADLLAASSIETPSSVELVETPSSVELVETPSSVELVETTDQVSTGSTSEGVSTGSTSEGVSTGSTSEGVSTGSTDEGVSTGSTSEGVSTGSTSGGIVLDVGQLADAPPALRRRALRAAALAVGCPPGATSARHVDALEALVVSWRGQGDVHLPGDARALRACGRLYLRPAGPGPDEPGPSRTGVAHPQPRTPAPIPLFEE